MVLDFGRDCTKEKSLGSCMKFAVLCHDKSTMRELRRCRRNFHLLDEILAIHLLSEHFRGPEPHHPP